MVPGKDEIPRLSAWSIRLTQIPIATAILSKLQAWRLLGTRTTEETVGNDHTKHMLCRQVSVP